MIDVASTRGHAHAPAVPERGPGHEAAAIEAEVVPTEQRELRAGFAGAGRLSGAMLASGVLAYAFHVLAARSLGVEAYGQVSVLRAALLPSSSLFCFVRSSKPPPAESPTVSHAGWRSAP